MQQNEVHNKATASSTSHTSMDEQVNIRYGFGDKLSGEYNLSFLTDSCTIEVNFETDKNLNVELRCPTCSISLTSDIESQSCARYIGRLKKLIAGHLLMTGHISQPVITVNAMKNASVTQLQL